MWTRPATGMAETQYTCPPTQDVAASLPCDRIWYSGRAAAVGRSTFFRHPIGLRHQRHWCVAGPTNKQDQ